MNKSFDDKIEKILRLAGAINDFEEPTKQLNVDPKLFWSYENIAFSHSNCNAKASRINSLLSESDSVSAQKETV